MDMETSVPYGSTLMAELGDWKRLEQSFVKAFGPESLRDREFLKMKLAAYERIARSHRGSLATVDDTAMLKMLGHQRRKMERVLYPGLTTRLLRRALLALKDQLFQSAAAPRMSDRHDYSSGKQAEFGDALQDQFHEKSESKRRYGHDWGRRQERDQGKGMGI